MTSVNAITFLAQGQESLNPNNMEFWMDDIYTPGYDALLRRKEAGLRRAKVCKLVALVATAVAIILIIVIPICTMGSWRLSQAAHIVAHSDFIYLFSATTVCAVRRRLHTYFMEISSWETVTVRP